MNKTRDFWKSKGFPDAAVAGILANVGAESGFDPNASGDGGTSLGLYQHHAERRAALIARYGAHPTADQQNQFMYDELMKDPRYRNTVRDLMNSHDPIASGALWSRDVERPKDADGEATRRGLAAPRFATQMPAGASARSGQAGGQFSFSGDFRLFDRSGVAAAAPLHVNTIVGAATAFGHAR